MVPFTSCNSRSSFFLPIAGASPGPLDPVSLGLDVQSVPIVDSGENCPSKQGKQNDAAWTTQGLEACRQAGIVDEFYKLYQSESLEKLVEPLEFQETAIVYSFGFCCAQYTLAFSDQTLLSFIKEAYGVFDQTIESIHQQGESCVQTFGIERMEGILTKIAPSLKELRRTTQTSHLDRTNRTANYIIELPKGAGSSRSSSAKLPSLQSVLVSAIIQGHYSVLNFEVRLADCAIPISSFEALVRYIIKHRAGYGPNPSPILEIVIINDAIPFLTGYRLTGVQLCCFIEEIDGWNVHRSFSFLHHLESLAIKYIFVGMTNDWNDYLRRLNPVFDSVGSSRETALIDGEIVSLIDCEKVVCFNTFSFTLVHDSIDSPCSLALQPLKIDMMPVLNGEKHVNVKGNTQSVFDVYFHAIRYVNLEHAILEDWIDRIWHLTNKGIEVNPAVGRTLIQRLLERHGYHDNPEQAILDIGGLLMHKLHENQCRQEQPASTLTSFCFLFNVCARLKDEVGSQHIAVLWSYLSNYYSCMPQGFHPLNTIAPLLRDNILGFKTIYALLHIHAFQHAIAPSSNHLFQVSTTALPTHSSLQMHVQDSVLVFPRSPLKSFERVQMHYKYLAEQEGGGVGDCHFKAMSLLIENLALHLPVGVDPRSQYYTRGEPVKMEPLMEAGEKLIQSENPFLCNQGCQLLLQCLSVKPSRHLLEVLLKQLPTAMKAIQDTSFREYFIRGIKNSLPAIFTEKGQSVYETLNNFLEGSLSIPFDLDSYLKVLIATRITTFEKIAFELWSSHQTRTQLPFMDLTKYNPALAISHLVRCHESGLASAISVEDIIKLGDAILVGKACPERVQYLYDLLKLIAYRLQSGASCKHIQMLLREWLLDLLSRNKAPEALLFAQMASKKLILNHTLFTKAITLIRSFSKNTQEGDFEFLIQHCHKIQNCQKQEAYRVLFLELVFQWKEACRVEESRVEALVKKWGAAKEVPKDPGLSGSTSIAFKSKGQETADLRYLEWMKKMENTLDQCHFDHLQNTVEQALNEFNVKKFIEHKSFRLVIEKRILNCCSAKYGKNGIKVVKALMSSSKIRTFFESEDGEYVSLYSKCIQIMLEGGQDGSRLQGVAVLLLMKLQTAMNTKSSPHLISSIELLEQFLEKNPDHGVLGNLQDELSSRQDTFIELLMHSSESSSHIVRLINLLGKLNIPVKMTLKHIDDILNAVTDLITTYPDQMLHQFTVLKKVFSHSDRQHLIKYHAAAIEIINLLFKADFPDTALECYELMKSDRQSRQSIVSLSIPHLSSWIDQIASYTTLPSHSYGLLSDLYRHIPERRAEALELMGKLPGEGLKPHLADALTLLGDYYHIQQPPSSCKKIHLFVKRVLNGLIKENLVQGTLPALLDLLHQSQYPHDSEWVLLLHEIMISENGDLQNRAWSYAKHLILRYSPLKNNLIIKAYRQIEETMVKRWSAAFAKTPLVHVAHPLIDYFNEALEALKHYPEYTQVPQQQWIYLMLLSVLSNQHDKATAGLVKVWIKTYLQITPYLEDRLHTDVLGSQDILKYVILIAVQGDVDCLREAFKLSKHLIAGNKINPIASSDTDYNALLVCLIMKTLTVKTTGIHADEDADFTKKVLVLSEHLVKNKLAFVQYSAIINKLLGTHEESLTMLAFKFANAWLEYYHHELQDPVHAILKEKVFFDLIAEGLRDSKGTLLLLVMQLMKGKWFNTIFVLPLISTVTDMWTRSFVTYLFEDSQMLPAIAEDAWTFFVKLESCFCAELAKEQQAKEQQERAGHELKKLVGDLLDSAKSNSMHLSPSRVMEQYLVAIVSYVSEQLYLRDSSTMEEITALIQNFKSQIEMKFKLQALEEAPPPQGVFGPLTNIIQNQSLIHPASESLSGIQLGMMWFTVSLLIEDDKKVSEQVIEAIKKFTFQKKSSDRLTKLHAALAYHLCKPLEHRQMSVYVNEEFIKLKVHLLSLLTPDNPLPVSGSAPSTLSTCLDAMIGVRQQSSIICAADLLSIQIYPRMRSSPQATIQMVRKLSLTPLYFQDNNLEKLMFVNSLAANILKYLDAFPCEKQFEDQKVLVWENMVKHYQAAFTAIPFPGEKKEQDNYLQCLSNYFSYFQHAVYQNSSAPYKQSCEKYLSILLERFLDNQKNKRNSLSSDQSLFLVIVIPSYRFFSELLSLLTLTSGIPSPIVASTFLSMVKLWRESLNERGNPEAEQMQKKFFVNSLRFVSMAVVHHCFANRHEVFIEEILLWLPFCRREIGNNHPDKIDMFNAMMSIFVGQPVSTTPKTLIEAKNQIDALKKYLKVISGDSEGKKFLKGFDVHTLLAPMSAFPKLKQQLMEFMVSLGVRNSF